MDPAELAARGWTRETSIRRDASGRWFDDGTLIDHPGISNAFDGWIEAAPDGRYCLKNSIHWVYADIEGPPYFVRGVQANLLMLSGGRSEALDPTTIRTVQGVLWCDVLGGTVPARFDNAAAIQLSESIDDGDTDEGPVLLFNGVRYPIAEL